MRRLFLLLVLATTRATSPLSPALLVPPPSERFSFAPPCPFGDEVRGIELANAAVHLLTLEGRLEEAVACNALLLANARGGDALPDEAREAVRGNQGALRQALAPWQSGVPRLYHTINDTAGEWPPHSDTPLVKPSAAGRKWGPDRAIQVYDGAMTEAECADVVALFERSDLFQGNVVSNGQCVGAPRCARARACARAPTRCAWAPAAPTCSGFAANCVRARAADPPHSRARAPLPPAE